ncbi:hypothetical protein K431DRAFT_319515 [Polychaeton citri CBS 116435]|uniref:U1-type domain-containing protein n=1 Tax=Polychaeton citri CBS 116435 TaxID=1314669 RepID=A0A9P4Q929_9PEZI|nr:hypothetical protein K431DRAFT_319515 [Polychaeton citri CBS 116435]
MSEYWKSTPNYWCKFCKIYVRDTTSDKKNHEATPKHQNNIQRSIRELGKAKEREGREAARAKEEVARLNGVVSGNNGQAAGASNGPRGQKTTVPPPTTVTQVPKLSTTAQKLAHAEQLAAMGVELPEELKREVTGVGGWQVVSERVVPDPQLSISQTKTNTGLSESKDGIKVEALSKGVRKRQVEGNDEEEEEVLPKRKAWGNRFKSYPEDSGDDSTGLDLDVLLGGIAQKQAKQEEDVNIKKEEPAEEEERVPLDAVPDAESNTKKMKVEETDDTAPPPVVFKKRKAKR